MSEEIKYEMIFGDEALFFDAQQDCEMVGNGHHKVENGKIMVWNFSEKYWAESHANKITIAAMRRIIKEPKRWTVEDQKAGRLPEVGALLVNVETGNQFSFVGVNAGSYRWACRNIQDGFLYFFKAYEMSPIESPEERAKREREEWCSKALDSAGILSEMKRYELKRLGEYIGSIHDALQSGELQAPKGW